MHLFANKPCVRVSQHAYYYIVLNLSDVRVFTCRLDVRSSTFIKRICYAMLRKIYPAKRQFGPVEGEPLPSLSLFSCVSGLHLQQ